LVFNDTKVGCRQAVRGKAYRGKPKCAAATLSAGVLASDVKPGRRVAVVARLELIRGLRCEVWNRTPMAGVCLKFEADVDSG